MLLNINLTQNDIQPIYQRLYTSRGASSDKPQIFCAAMVDSIKQFYEINYPMCAPLNDEFIQNLLGRFMIMSERGGFSWNNIVGATNEALIEYNESYKEDPSTLSNIEYYLTW